MRGVRSHLLARTPPTRLHPRGLAYVGELVHASVSPKMDHLVCFLPGLLALGAAHGVETARAGVEGDAPDLALAADLALTCAEMYRGVPAGLAPEIAHFRAEAPAEPAAARGDAGAGPPPPPPADDPAASIGRGAFTVKPADAHHILRPEAVESWFVLWRVTRDVGWRDLGWAAFRAWEAHCRVPWGGYAGLDSVLEGGGGAPFPKRDKMESFFVAETLKYLYLLFDDTPGDLLPLDEYVFTTEAHPLPVAGSKADQAAAEGYLKPPYAPPPPLPPRRNHGRTPPTDPAGAADAASGLAKAAAKAALRSRIAAWAAAGAAAAAGDAAEDAAAAMAAAGGGRDAPAAAS